MLKEKTQKKKHTKRNRVVIYNCIISRLKQLSSENLSDKATNNAARNLIGLYEIILDYQKDKNKKLQQQRIKNFNDSS